MMRDNVEGRERLVEEDYTASARDSRKREKDKVHEMLEREGGHFAEKRRRDRLRVLCKITLSLEKTGTEGIKI